MGAGKDQRFECECGAEIVYTKDCPGEWLRDPRCVCGRHMRAVATQNPHTAPTQAPGADTETGVTTGQKLMCECGSKVKYTRASLLTTVSPFTCVCGATGTETREED